MATHAGYSCPRVMVCTASEKVVGGDLLRHLIHLCSVIVTTGELFALESLDFHFTVSKLYDISSVNPLSVCIQVLAS